MTNDTLLSGSRVLTNAQAQLSSSNSALGASREEMKKLELQLKTRQQQHEADLARRNKTHTATVQELEHKVHAQKTADNSS